MTDDEIIAVVTAHKEGKPIQCRLLPIGDWFDNRNPAWAFNNWEYRVKPRPPREWIVLAIGDSLVRKEERDLVRMAEMVRVREVMDEPA